MKLRLPFLWILLLILMLSGCSLPSSTTRSIDNVSDNTLVMIGLESEAGNAGSGFYMIFEMFDPSLELGLGNTFKFELINLASSKTSSFNALLSEGEVSYFLFEGKPGIYALRSVLNHIGGPASGRNYESCMAEETFYVELLPGMVNYIGNFRIIAKGSSSQVDVVPLGYDEAAALNAQAELDNITAPQLVAANVRAIFPRACR
jgi:hypothetical protein